MGSGVSGSMAVPVEHQPCGSVGCKNGLLGHGVAPAEAGQQAKEGLAFGAWGTKQLVGWGKRQPAKNKAPSLGHAELCLCPAIPWGLRAKEEWLKMGR